MFYSILRLFFEVPRESVLFCQHWKLQLAPDVQVQVQYVLLTDTVFCVNLLTNSTGSWNCTGLRRMKKSSKVSTGKSTRLLSLIFIT